MKQLAILAITAMLFSDVVMGQTLTTAETLGKGNESLFFAGNALIVKDFTTCAYNYGQFLYGLTNRIDLYSGIGATTGLGQTQWSAILGPNVNLVKSKIVSVSNYTTINTGLNNRSQSCPAWVFNSIVVSKNFKLRKQTYTGYSGYSFLVPLGHDKSDKLFTPPKTCKNIPMGLAIPVGKQFLFVEYNYGRDQQMVSLGLAITP
jgi:hypothetical protein